MKFKRWVMSELDKDMVNELAEECNTDPFATLVAVSRGYTEPYLLDEFLSDDFDLDDPYAMTDMEAAVERVKAAVTIGEKITVFGDYDCDGVTATALLYKYLKEKGAEVDFYIPDRETEGYGMTKCAIEKIAKNGTELIITVDNGIAANEEVRFAKEKGIDVVVTDHHLQGGDLPEAVAVIDPHRDDDYSELDCLSGVGVVFKLISALEGASDSEMLEKYSDIVTLGTIADIVPLKDENRRIVRYGLQRLKRTENIGILALLSKASIDKKGLTVGSVSFSIVPRLNAAGRMGDAARAVRLLITEDENEAFFLAGELNQENIDRQEVCAEIFEQAVEKIYLRGLQNDNVIVVEGEGWHPGVIGIVASKIVERFSKPAILLTVADGVAHGSGRGTPAFSLYDAIAQAKNVLEKYGGHKLAAGVTLKERNIEQFRSIVNEFAKSMATFVPEIEITCKLNPKAIGLPMVKALEVLEPFGEGNPVPIFAVYNMRIDRIAPLKDGKHIKLYLSRGGASIQVLSFGTPIQTFAYEMGDTVDVAVQMGINTYMGQQNLSLTLKDIRMSGLQENSILKQESVFGLYESGRLTPDNVNEIYPTRDDFIAVYKVISESKKILFDRVILKTLAIGPGKVGIILEAMEELGLITVESQGELKTALLNEIAHKVNLADSSAIKYLKQLGGKEAAL